MDHVCTRARALETRPVGTARAGPADNWETSRPGTRPLRPPRAQGGLGPQGTTKQRRFGAGNENYVRRNAPPLRVVISRCGSGSRPPRAAQVSSGSGIAWVSASCCSRHILVRIAIILCSQARSAPRAPCEPSARCARSGEKYKGKKDQVSRQKMSQALQREAQVSPFASCLPICSCRCPSSSVYAAPSSCLLHLRRHLHLPRRNTDHLGPLTASDARGDRIHRLRRPILPHCAVFPTASPALSPSSLPRSSSPVPCSSSPCACPSRATCPTHGRQ